ncbi:RloB domain-containing protein [Pusillimonas sp. TS35]|uniref:RloB family protein n=1 Tax=Paracandidimonas lactea TaxID=2895524 RepID=UPI00137157E0|nr:RloB family protein [Paracandidimonas lactea]MYN13894.1 RloB domain-containing protein [Pusillimonas sp. TS35]
MGHDDLFRKRKARTSTALQRRKRERERSKRYLIVCEGTKTEPQYLRELLHDLRIRPQLVRVAPNDGASPDRVVAHALSLYDEDALTGDVFDQVYCMFDRDRHSTFDGAVTRVKDLAAAGKPFAAITSTPCFEVWLLLHFRYSDQPFHAAGRKSVGDQVVSVLRTMPGFEKYGKGQKGVYGKLKEKLANAFIHAERLRRQGATIGSINPATNVDELIRAIQALAIR